MQLTIFLGGVKNVPFDKAQPSMNRLRALGFQRFLWMYKFSKGPRKGPFFMLNFPDACDTEDKACDFLFSPTVKTAVGKLLLALGMNPSREESRKVRILVTPRRSITKRDLETRCKAFTRFALPPAAPIKKEAPPFVRNTRSRARRALNL